MCDLVLSWTGFPPTRLISIHVFLTIGASVFIKYSPWLDSQFLHAAELPFDNENH